MSINIQECSNIETNILELNMSILKQYLNDKQYNELDKYFFINNINKKLNLEQLCSEYDFFKDKEHNFLLDQIYDLTKFKFSFFKKPDKFIELAQVINIINQKYNVDTISIFEVILFSYNISKTKTSKISIKTFKEELISLNTNNTITINDFFKKMFIDFYMYSYLCGNYSVNNEIIKKVNNLISRYYTKNKIIQKANLSKFNILIEPYAVSSIISIKIINFVLYQLYKYNLLDIFLSRINTFETIFKTKFLEFLNDRSIEINIARIKKLDSEELAKYLKDKYDENKLLYIDHHEIILSFFLNSDKRIIEYKELLSSGTYQLNKLIYYKTIDNFIKVNIEKLALILIIYNYYYGNIIKENFIDTYINYIKYMAYYIFKNDSDYERNNKYWQYLKKNFKVLNIEFKQKSQSNKLSPIIELPLNIEKEELETSKLSPIIELPLTTKKEELETSKVRVKLGKSNEEEQTKTKEKELSKSIPSPKKRHLTRSFDSYNKKSSFKTNSLNSKKPLTDSFKKELEEIKQIEKILNILKNTVSIDDYNKYFDEFKKILDFLKIRDLELYKKYNIQLQQINKTILYYNKLNNISTKEELENLKKELKLNEIYNFKLIETKYNELSEYIDLVTKILEDKLYRLVHYTRLKINNLSIIYKSYEKTFDELKYIKEIIGSVENNSKKISDLSKLMLAYNKKYNINYYNYGSEASLLLLLIPNVTLEDIRYYVDEYRNEYKNKQIALQKKYALSDYLNKIGYDLAICQYVFTDISFIFSKEQFDKIINIILHDAYDIMDKYIIDLNNYYSKIMNLESISNSNIKKQTKKEQIEKIFNNDLYKEQKEQLKYNLYKYKYKQFPNKPTAVLLWFINTVVLRFSDI
jgi:hypothetical protein